MEAKTAAQAAKMHMNFFDRSRRAIEDGYYLEAIMYEYAAIEGRLEVMCSVLGLPCNKDMDPADRKDIKISQRVSCLKSLYKKHPAAVGSPERMDSEFWRRLESWLRERNTCVHGLYKDPAKYTERLEDRERLARAGLELAGMLYSETKRLRRMKKELQGK